MWPDRRVIDLFGIEHPLILAPMTGPPVRTPDAALPHGEDRFA